MDGFGFTPSDVEDDLSILEEVISGASSTDEYLEALLRSNIAMMEMMAENDLGTMKTVNGVPDSTAGMAVADTPEGNMGYVVFQVDGRSVVEKFEAIKDINAEEVVVVDWNQGGVIPVSNVGESHLGIGGIEFQSEDVGSYEIYQTEDAVDILPGDEKTVLEISTTRPVAITKIGTNDETYSKYRYIADGERLNDVALYAPLGLYNDMFEFTKPLQFTEKFEVVVKRDSDAKGVADYYSNAVVVG